MPATRRALKWYCVYYPDRTFQGSENAFDFGLDVDLPGDEQGMKFCNIDKFFKTISVVKDWQRSASVCIAHDGRVFVIQTQPRPH